MGNSHSNSQTRAQVKSLSAEIKAALDHDGELYAFPGDPFYKLRHVRPYNLDRVVRPFCVTYPRTTKQVAEVVRCAARAGMKVQARGGGHSYANYCIGGVDGSVVIDVKNFQHFSLDPTTNHATIGAGTLLGSLDARLHEAGNRAIAHGTCPQVGISGHATIGGLGPTSRLWGTTLDHVLSAEIVLADSSIVHASAESNPDVFWAIRGAGASFGIITEFVMRTEPEPDHCVQFSYKFNLGSYSSMARTFKSWQKFVSDPDLPRNLASEVIITQLGMVIKGTYFGPRSAFDLLDIEDRICSSPPSSSSGSDDGVKKKKEKRKKCDESSVIEFTDYLGAVTHWAEEVALQIGGGISAPLYTKSLTFNKCNLIPEPVVDALFRYLDRAEKGTAVWFLIFDLEGGRVNDVGEGETAYAHRDALFYLQSYAVGVPRLRAKTRRFLRGITETVVTGMREVGGEDEAGLGAYAGYVDPELVDGQKQYWRTNLPRLEQIKLAVDPTDVFSNPQSVRPAGSPPDPPFVQRRRNWLKWLCVS